MTLLMAVFFTIWVVLICTAICCCVERICECKEYQLGKVKPLKEEEEE